MIKTFLKVWIGVSIFIAVSGVGAYYISTIGMEYFVMLPAWGQALAPCIAFGLWLAIEYLKFDSLSNKKTIKKDRIRLHRPLRKPIELMSFPRIATEIIPH